MSGKEKRGSTGLAVKAGFWYVLSNFLVKGLAFITTPIFARLMSEAAYGEFSNYASWQSTLLIITGAELYSTLNRAYYDYKNDYDKYVSSVTFLGCGITVVFYFLFLLCGKWIYNIVAIPKEFVHVLFFSLIFQCCKEIFMARERTMYRYKTVAAMSVINLVFPTLVSVAMVIMAAEPQRLSARIYGFYIPASLIGLYCAFVLIAKGKSFKIEHCKYALKLSLPLLVHYLTAYLLTSSNTMVTKSVLGAEEAALVSITTSTIHIFTILMQALSGAVTTWMMDNMEQNNTSLLRKGLVIYVGGIAVAAIGVMLLAPEVIWILGGSTYAKAVSLMPGMILAVAIQSITTLFTIILTYKKTVVETAVYTAILAGVSIFGKIFLLPVYGIQILPWINIAAFGILYLIEYLLVKKCGQSAIINFKGFNAGVLIIALVMVSCNFLYQNVLIRYGVILLMGACALIVLYKYRELVLGFVKNKLSKKKGDK